MTAAAIRRLSLKYFRSYHAAQLEFGRAGPVVLTSKLIDGTFPDYGRVIPVGNDKTLTVDKKDFEAAVDRGTV
jgi:DNA polymerase III sliding clamp (beta) subunit (PCNA family)